MNTTLSKQRENTTANPVSYRRPAYSVETLKDAYEVRVEMPGVNKAGINLSCEKDTLTISASRKEPGKDDWKPLHREVRPSDYELKLNLNVDIDTDKITANTENGILMIRLPVAEQAKPKLIQVD